ncbi:MAG: SRPBCC domain-containing protein [Prevotellaceae bacterium]|jgi:hypothetical protein|nr:SRPBCC domain-containing protein [Prevotellaceae bacterium]
MDKNRNIFVKELYTEILINAHYSLVWNVFSKFNEYPQWNPFIKLIKGEIKAGNRIYVKIIPPDSKEMVFKPKVLEFEENKKLKWLGRFIFPGLFDGEHLFELVDNKDGTTTFKQSEKYKGLFVPLLKNMLENNTKRGFVEMNEKIKEISEKPAS